MVSCRLPPFYRSLVVGIILQATSATESLQAAQNASSLPRLTVVAGSPYLHRQDGEPFVVVGVNYYRPHTGWAPQVWRKFDPEAIRSDFSKMQGLGVNCVRVFLSYESFFRDATKLDDGGIAKFDEFLAMAEAAGIYVIPTGPDHWEGTPEWAALETAYGDRHLAALEEFWRRFATRYRGRTAILAYDLKNEPEVPWSNATTREAWPRWLESQYEQVNDLNAAWSPETRVTDFKQLVNPPEPAASPPRQLLDYQRFRESLADEWTRRQAEVIKTVDPAALVTVGLVQWSVPSLLSAPQHYSGFRADRQSPWVDFHSIHFYPFDQGVYDYRSPAEEIRNMAYLEGVLHEVAQAGKPVMLTEFGWYGGGKPGFDQGRHPTASDEQQAQYCSQVIAASDGLVAGWLNWGLYDVPEATDASELTGLLTSHGLEKSWARSFRRLAAERRAAPPPRKSLVGRPALDWNEAVTDPEVGNKFREAYFEAYSSNRAN